MALVDVLLQVGVVVIVGHLLTMLLVVERTDRRRDPERLSAVGRIRSNLTSVAPTLGVLAAVLAINKVVRDIGVELSWLIGVNLTGYIYLVESQFVATVQSFAHPALTTYFGFVYVFGYTFLLTFPVLAYAICERARPLRVLFLTYILNYGFGLLCYVLVVAYGPRNFMPELVDPLLYSSWPQSQLLVQQVNVNTNVFPSLHTSLSATVALLAYRFRALYPRWLPIATVLSVSIIVSTMYLGIHWATDVVAGVAVAWASVELAERIDDGTLSGSLRRWQRRGADAIRK
ncbi:phosphatase PAP2 family protein [Halobellus rarus]|uniref:Phosphatase PAP2 family protein n=1 Tax=Halobellus rarus TaxID=1126237 RepID=A0ABD6CLR3_9EURY|nr:phosphatase PAP2 family protein [Halobellus rarus]